MTDDRADRQIFSQMANLAKWQNGRGYVGRHCSATFSLMDCELLESQEPNNHFTIHYIVNEIFNEKYIDS